MDLLIKCHLLKTLVIRKKIVELEVIVGKNDIFYILSYYVTDRLKRKKYHEPLKNPLIFDLKKFSN